MIENENKEIIDEQEVIDNLVEDKDMSTTNKQFNNHRVVYAKSSGCFDIGAILINILVYAIAILLTNALFREGFYMTNFWTAFYVAFVMSILNVILKPILVFMTLPLTFMTFGLFYVIINGSILYIADWIVGPSFEIRSFFMAIIASIFISMFRMAINFFILKDNSFKVN